MTYPPPAGYPDPNQPQQGWTPAPVTPGQPSDPSIPTDVFGDAATQQHPQHPQGPGGAYPPPPSESFLPPQPPKKRGNAGVLVGLLIFVVLVAGAVAAYFLGVFDPAPTADDDKKTETTSEETGDDVEDPSEDPGDEVAEGAPTATVEAYYAAAEAHDADGLVATMCAATKAEYDQQGMTEAQWQQIWDAADKMDYEIVGETIGEDGTTAQVTVDQVADGASRTVTAELVLEEGQWLICTFS